jgi:hypothetical protein
MRELGPDERREWHRSTLDKPPRDYGLDARLQFWLVPQLIAFAIYQQFWLLRALNPAHGYRLNADVEDHAEHEYARLVAEHPEWESDPFPSPVASGYTAYESLADLFRQIGSDEGFHKELSLARLADAGSS